MAEHEGSFTRRALLRGGLFAGGTLLLAGGLVGWTLRLRPAAPGRQVLGQLEVEFIEAVAEAYLPPGNVLGVDAAGLDAAAGMDRHAAGLPRFEQRVLRGILGVIDNWPRVKLHSTSRVTDMPLDERVAFIASFDASANPIQRSLAYVLRVLVGLSIFQNDALLAAIGHRDGCPTTL
jgi:hypothetical protein